MMTLTPQLRKIAIKKRASHPSSIPEPDIVFQKLVDKLDQAEITMKLEKTESLKQQHPITNSKLELSNIQTITSQIINIQDSDNELAEKITQIMNICEKNPNFKGKPSFTKWCNYCGRYGHSIAECRPNQQDDQNKHQKHREPFKPCYQYTKKVQNLPNKNLQSNNSLGKPLRDSYNNYRSQSRYRNIFPGRSPDRRNSPFKSFIIQSKSKVFKQWKPKLFE